MLLPVEEATIIEAAVLLQTLPGARLHPAGCGCSKETKTQGGDCHGKGLLMEQPHPTSSNDGVKVMLDRDYHLQLYEADGGRKLDPISGLLPSLQQVFKVPHIQISSCPYLTAGIYLPLTEHVSDDADIRICSWSGWWRARMPVTTGL